MPRFRCDFKRCRYFESNNHTMKLIVRTKLIAFDISGKTTEMGDERQGVSWYEEEGQRR